MSHIVYPRTAICKRCLRQLQSSNPLPRRTLATASAITPAPSPSQMTDSPPPISRYPPNQPPSHKSPVVRNAQLHRQYTSLLRSTPLILFFSHFQLLSGEWMALRRELSQALAKTDDSSSSTLSSAIKLQVIQTNMFEFALRVTDYYRPQPPPSARSASDPATQSSNETIPNVTTDSSSPQFTHGLSTHAYESVRHLRGKHPLNPLLSGPLALLTFPSISPAHLKAALSILSPDKGAGFPAPTRRGSPGYYDPACQNAVQKLLLVGARVEGGVWDKEKVQWLGGMKGLEDLRAELVGLLSSAGVGLVAGLEGAGKSLWMTMESRRMAMEEEAGGKGAGKAGED